MMFYRIDVCTLQSDLLLDAKEFGMDMHGLPPCFRFDSHMEGG